MNKNQKRLLNYAYYLLARRRYTVHEMIDKLYTKNQTIQEPCADLELQEILAALIKANFLNDQDFIYFYIEAQLRKKPQGINKIVASLQKKGLEKAQIKKTYEQFSVDELSQATDALTRKIGNRLHQIAADYNQNTTQDSTYSGSFKAEAFQEYLKTKQKYFRYLQARGFSADISLKAVSNILKFPEFNQSDL